MANMILQGPAKWFKLIGEARPNKFKGGQLEYSTNIGIGSKEKMAFKANKVRKGIKFDEDIGDFISINVLAKDREYEVVDKDGNEWPDDKWVGNGSIVEITCRLKPFDFVKEGEQIKGNSLVPTLVKIVEHKPYVKAGGTATKEKRVDNNNWADEEDDE